MEVVVARRVSGQLQPPPLFVQTGEFGQEML